MAAACGQTAQPRARSACRPLGVSSHALAFERVFWPHGPMYSFHRLPDAAVRTFSLQPDGSGPPRFVAARHGPPPATSKPDLPPSAWGCCAAARGAPWARAPRGASGISAAAAGRPDSRLAWAAGGIGALACIIFLEPATGVTAIVMATAAVAGLARLARRQIGGYNGDTLGAAQQVAEIAVLVVVAAHAA